ncbi:MAG: hypothetical protein GY856_46920 [bacterium]|nr:hypothetical protein [bacterium]
MTCSAFHFGAVSPALSRIRVAKLEEIGVEVAIACLSCLEKPCLECCPCEALAVGDQGEIVLDAELCCLCESCVDACPVGAVGFHDDGPLHCDLCGGAVACIATCPSNALSYQEENRDVSLADFSQSVGSAGTKRAGYAREQGAPIRQAWKEGLRVDS